MAAAAAAGGDAGDVYEDDSEHMHIAVTVGVQKPSLFMEDQPDAAASAAGGAKVCAAEEEDGKGLMAVHPWEGAVYYPDDAADNDRSPPNVTMDLEWVYGYRCKGVRNNIAVDSQRRLIFTAAAVVVAYDPASHTQTFYRGHNDDIVSLAQNPVNPNIIATGQVASHPDGRSMNPYICVYNWATGEEYKLPNLHQRYISALAFSPDGSLLASAGGDNDYTIMVWDWKNKTRKASIGASQKVEVASLAWCNDTTVCGCGPKVVAFYQISGSGMNIKQGKMGSFDRAGFLCVAVSHGQAFVSTDKGEVYEFSGDACVKAHKVSDAAVSCIAAAPGGGFAVGVASGVSILDAKCQAVSNVPTGQGRCHAIAYGDSVMWAGTRAGELYRVATGEAPQLILMSHHDGELWALDPHPTSHQLVSAGEDNKILVWDTANHIITQIQLASTAPAGLRKKVPRACTSSTQVAERCTRAVTYSPDGNHIAIGTNSGVVHVFEAASLSKIASVDCNKLGKVKNNIPENWIQEIRYNPTGTVLAVATHGSVVALIDVKAGYVPKGALTSSTAAVCAFDWSTDGKFIQTADISRELLYYSVTADLKSSKQVTSASAMKTVQWATQSVPFGWSVEGISLQCEHVQNIAKSNAGDLIMTGDDTGATKLYRYPLCESGNQYIDAKGHSSYVCRVKFSHDDRFCYSAGGGDLSIMQWRIHRADE